VLTGGGDPSAIDAATRRVRDERWPEVVTVQQMQEKQGSVFFNDRWSVRLAFRLLPCLMRTGLLQWLRLSLHVSKGNVTALIRWLLLCPDGAYGRQILVSPTPTVVEWHAESPELGLTPADAEAKDEPAIGQYI